MAESPLSALVEGYQQGQEEHRKKAEKIAKEQAEKFSQEFQVSEAKRQAEYQKQQQKLSEQRNQIEKQYADQQKTKIENDKEKAEADRQTKVQLAEISAHIKQDANYMKNGDNYRKEYLRIIDRLSKQKPDSSEDEWQQEAQHILSRFDTNYNWQNVAGTQGQGAASMPHLDFLQRQQQAVSGQQPPPAQFGQQQFIRPNADGAPAMNNEVGNPVGVTADLLKKAQTAAKIADTEYKQSLAKAELGLKKAQTENYKATADRTRKIAETIYAKNKADIGYLEARTKQAMASIGQTDKRLNIEQQRANTERIKADFTVSSKKNNAGKDAANQLKQWMNEKKTLSERQDKINGIAEEADALITTLPGLLREGKITREEYNAKKLKAEQIKINMGQANEENVTLRLNAEEQYQTYRKLVADNNVKMITSPSGEANHAANKANRAAIDAVLKRTQRSQRQNESGTRRHRGATGDPLGLGITPPAAHRGAAKKQDDPLGIR